MKRYTRHLAILLISIGISGCYTYHKRDKVLIPNIDIDATLTVAELDLKRPDKKRAMTLWAMRDQILTESQAQKVQDLYFEYIETIDSETQSGRSFAVWHLTWAISNMYRQGETNIKDILKEAYADAAKRVDKLHMKIATQHFYDQKIYMGDVHALGRGYAKSHLVVPGNEDYLQSADEYEIETE